MSETLRDRALQTLRQRFGYNDFREGQWEVIENILSHRDTMVLLPTGGGKSLCYQIPALISEGCCIVVSPLISLMDDQVTALKANGIEAAAVNSMNAEGENRLAFEDAIAGRIKLIYISPERLLSDLDGIMMNLPVSFIAVDEAHCISQWGHDFRPDYKILGEIKRKWPAIPVVALTATADRLTRDDIVSSLNLHDPYVYIGSFNRPNLSLTVISGATRSERLHTIGRMIRKYPMDCGIVYCLSRNKTEAMWKALTEAGFRAGCYHAGMTADERDAVQREFVNGELQVMCATVAFGMGIDKSNIRWVVHNNLPGNIESYYQEIGRAGRDGMAAETILFYSYSDVILRRTFVEESALKDVNQSKLDFMQHYAEASVCRRRILLSYFSEETEKDCGNCDNCLNPPPRFDGTRVSQMALSCIVRVKSLEGMYVITDLLRGVAKRDYVEKGYDRLSTFGIGKDLSAAAWQSYILQMIQLGLVEVAYEENFHLRPTQAGWRVLRGERQVELARFIPRVYTDQRRNQNHYRRPEPPRVLTLEERLDVQLRELRKKLAAKIGIADYMVFSDATIADIVDKKPKTLRQFLAIEGISLSKFAAYYKPVLSEVRSILGEGRTLPKGISNGVTYILFQRGVNLKKISEMRGYTLATVLNHLVEMANNGYEVDTSAMLPADVLKRIEELYIPVEKARKDMSSVSSDNDIFIAAYQKAKSEFESELEKENLTLDDFNIAMAVRRIRNSSDNAT